MAFDFDPVALLNLGFDLVILGIGGYAYLRRRSTAPLWIGAGFGLFGISYALTIAGVDGPVMLLLALRVLGYLAVLVALSLVLLPSPRRTSARSALDR